VTPPDRIELRDLRVTAVHGLLDEERHRPQPFSVDVDLDLDTAAAAGSDALADTVDYGAAVAAAVAVLTGAPHQLLESLAAAVAAALLADPRVDQVTVTLRKLRPPVPYDLASAGVRVTRRRP